MKKMICMLLAVMIMLGLCACGEKETSDKREKKENREETLSFFEENMAEEEMQNNNGEPTEEQMDLLLEYNMLVYDLHTYDYSEEDLAQRYELLLQMDEVDQFLGTEYITEAYFSQRGYNYYEMDEAFWNRQFLLEQFVVLENIKLDVTKSSEDFLGNTSDWGKICRWYYNGDGTIRSIYGEDQLQRVIAAPFYRNDESSYQYNSDGTVKEIVYSSYNTINQRHTFSYENGMISRREVINGNEFTEVLYRYNEEGKLVWMEWKEDYWRYSMEFTYQGDQLIREEKIRYFDDQYKDDCWVMEHVYNDSGLLVGSTYREQDWYAIGYNYNNGVYLHKETANTLSYVYDSNGRMTQATEMLGNTVTYYQDGTESSSNMPNEKSYTYTINYGRFVDFQ